MIRLSSRSSSRKFYSGLIIAVIVTACLLLAREPELRLAVPLLVGCTAVMVVMLAVTLYLGEKGALSWSITTILGVALLLRLLFVTAPPQLSDDIYRYLWDGCTLLRGGNPYASAPASVTPSPALSDIHRLINHPQCVTIYPPGAQVVFAGGAAVGGSVGLKALLVLLDMGLCALLVVLLQQLEIPVWRAVLYAWNPLPILEIAGSGHVDGVGLTLLMGAILLILSERKDDPSAALRRWPFYLSGGLLAGACLIKLFPLVLTPVFCLLVPRPRRVTFLAGFVMMSVALTLPFLPPLTNMLVSLEVYARNWEFAGFAFTTLRTLTGSGPVARCLLAGVLVMIVGVVCFRLKKRLNHELTTTGMGLAALAASYTITLSFLMLSPTLQPWYALSLAVLLPFCASPAGLLLCWAVFLTYQVQIAYFISGKWTENLYVTAAVFWAPLIVMVFNFGRNFIRNHSPKEGSGTEPVDISLSDCY